MGAVSTIQDLNNLAAERGRSGFDRRHTAVITTIWQIDYLPPATGWRRIANAVANGWTLSTISTLRSGSPLNITSGVDNNFDGSSSGDRPNVVFGIDPVLDPHRSRGRITGVDNGGVRGTWFNTAAFVQPVPGTFFGNSSRNTLEGPGAKSIDVAFLRTFNITERTKRQFRMEMTNAFNFVNLDNPNTSVNSSNFGKISGAGAARQLQLGLRLAF